MKEDCLFSHHTGTWQMLHVISLNTTLTDDDCSLSKLN